ncbi:hypothetical protein K469DRAFT_544903, partial [Zopfia rhizophila CBS 207.26]
RLAAEKSIKYRGIASIKLEVLHFVYEEDEENVSRLKKLFRKNGCDRLDIRNYVPTIINQQLLDAVI